MLRMLRETIETVLLALLLFVLMEFSVQNFRVEGSSMKPTLAQDQYLLVNKLVYARLDLDQFAPFIPFVDGPDSGSAGSVFAFRLPRHGDVVIFRYPADPSRDFVKRLIGVPGDTLEIKRGEVYRNGVPIDEPFITNPSTRSYDPVFIPDGHYYVLGDNRRASNDSREWGLVPDENLIGRAWLSYWPPGGMGIVD